MTKKAQKNNANAIIDIEIEYTNYNTRIPPDMLISAYGTAVIIDDKYL
ncbi:heavy metal-binding domain-containing protein [uncultured Methanosphaera sp.]